MLTKRLSTSVLWIALVLPASVLADITPGVNWLATQPNADGSFGKTPTSFATPIQSTAEVLRAYQALGEIAQPSVGPALTFLNNDTEINTEFLFRKIIVNAQAGNAVTPLVDALLTHQNTDGGFGDRAGYDSSVFDTAFVIEALAATNHTSGSQVAGALVYLLSRQQADGGWAIEDNGSAVYLTAQAMQALWHYRNLFAGVTAALTKAQNFLLSKRNANGGWSEDFETALALLAVIPTVAEFAQIEDSVAALRAQRRPNGSWQDDSYTTALALRALHLAENRPPSLAFGQLQGSVIDALSGLPLAGVTVALTGPTARALITNADGRFVFIDLVPGSHTLSFTLPGYVSITASAAAPGGQIIDLGVLPLTKTQGATTGAVQGTIIDGSTGLPLGGVSVSITGGGSAVTNSAGQYQITSVAPGAISVQATLSGYSSGFGTADVAAGGLLIFSPALFPVIAPTTAIQGTITDGISGVPLAGVSIAVSGSTAANAVTDAQGKYQIKGLTPGTILVTASLAGYDAVSATTAALENAILVFSPKLYLQNTTPPDANTAGVVGNVVDAGTNQPLANVTLTAAFGTSQKTVVTGPDGAFKIVGLDAVAGNLLFALPEFDDVSWGLTLQPVALFDLGQIRMRRANVATFLPDLVVDSVDAQQVVSNAATLAVSGSLSATVRNQGTAAARGSFKALAFYDRDRNNRYDAGTDIALGESVITGGLARDAVQTFTIDVQGELPFRDAPLTVWVDSAEVVVELQESNNVARPTGACVAEPPIGTFNPVVKYQALRGTNVISTPIVIDLNGDGISDVVVPTIPGGHFGGGPLKAFSGDDGRLLFTTPTTPASLLVATLNDMAAADIDGDGKPEIIAAANDNNHLIAFTHTGAVKWISDSHILPGRSDSGGAIAIANLDGVGDPEIVIGASVYSSTGRLLGDGGTLGGTVGFSFYTAISAVADINLDGIPEIVAGPSAYQYVGGQLTLLWRNANLPDGFVGIANFNADPFPEIVLVSGGKVYLLDHNGALLWGPVLIPGGGAGGAPTIGDFDGDGVPEIGVAGAARYVVFRADGTVLWQSVTEDFSSNNTGSTSFDFEGDGTVEIVYRDERFLRIYRGSDGAVLFQMPLQSGTATELPVIADVDGDGHADIIVSSDRLLFGGGLDRTGVYVISDAANSWVSTRRIWNQHSYHVTNINDDGTVPAVEQNSWQVHNTYRLNAFPDRNPLELPDLTAALLRFNAGTAGALPSLAVRVGNGGAAPSPPVVKVAFFEGDPSAGGRLLGEVTAPVLAAGGFTDVVLPDVTGLVGNVSLYALIDSGNRVSECREDNNIVSIPGPTLFPDFVVSAIDAAQALNDPQTLALSGSLTATIRNQGTLTAPAGVTALAFHDVNGNDVFDPGIDVALGSASTANLLGINASTGVTISLSGTLPFRDAPIKVWADSAEVIVEDNENNNIGNTASACEVTPQIGTFAPVLKWEWNGSTILPEFDQVMSIPIVAAIEDTNGDGAINQHDMSAVIFHSYVGRNFRSNGVLRALSGKDGHELWTVTDPAYRTNAEGSIAVADIDGDGIIEIIAPKDGGGIIVFEHTGEFKWQSLVPQAVFWGGPSISDLDGDGVPEIVVGNTALNADGSLRWQGTGFTGTNFSITGSLSIVADINLDGKPEVVAGAAAYSSTGQRLWQNSSVGDGFTAIGNFNEDPYPEIVVVSTGRLFLLDYQGSVLWGPVSLPGGGRGGAPTVADMDGDGIPEIGVAGANQYAVFKADGTLLWSVPTSDNSSSMTGSSVFDFDGDGRVEVVYADEFFLRVYRGSDGTVLFDTPNSSGTTYELPVIADLDNDNHADIVVSANQLLQIVGQAPGPGYKGIRVFQDKNNAWVNTRRIWNQHSYHITNINDDGTVPAVEQNSWQVHNTYRLNTQPGVSVNSASDLTTSLLRVLDSGSGQALGVSVRIGNAGAAPSPNNLTVTFYDGDRAAGGTLLASTTIASIAPAGFQDVTAIAAVPLSGVQDVFAVVDADNRVVECREDNNVTNTPLPASVRGIISVATDKAVYGPDSPAELRGTVTNTGALPGTYAVELRVEDLAGVEVQGFAAHVVTRLTGGDAVLITDAWNTGTILAGSYRLHGFLRNAAGAVVSEAVSTFEIRNAEEVQPAVTLRTTTDRTVYHTSDTVQIQNLVQNVSTNTLISGAVLQVTVLDLLNQVIFTQELPLADLVPGTLRDLPTPVSLNGSTVAIYRVLGAIRNPVTQALLATDETSFEVRFDLTKALTGAVVVESSILEVGEIQRCTVTVTNGGAFAALGLEVHRGLVNIDTEQLVSDQFDSVDLVSGASDSFTRSVETRALVAGNYACVLQVKIGDQLQTLAFAPFVLNEPPIRIDAQIEATGNGRLLVLLDPPRACDRDDQDNDKDHPDADHHRSSAYGDQDDKGKDKDKDASKDTSPHPDSGHHAGPGQPRLCDTDPHGPKAAPTLSTQRAFLEALLRQAGWSVTITETAADFTRALRTGGYSVYALLGEQEKLSEQTQKELREAVFRGEGLLVAGAHDDRHHKLQDALGLKLIGAVSHAVVADLLPGLQSLTGPIALIPGDKALRLKRSTAALAGVYLLGSPSGQLGDDDCRGSEAYRRSDTNSRDAAKTQGHSGDEDDEDDRDHDQDHHDDDGHANSDEDHCHGHPERYLDAVTVNAYGLGQAVFVGFDLLATATLEGAPGLADDLVLTALNAVNPATARTLPGAVVPITVQIQNQGIATPVRLAITAPPGSEILDALHANFDVGQATWDLDLAADETQTRTLWLRLPAAVGVITIEATVSAPNSQGVYEPRATPSVTLAVQAPMEPATLRALLAALIDAGSPFVKDLTQAERALARAEGYLPAKPAKALRAALHAADHLRAARGPEVDPVRALLAEWVRELAREANRVDGY